MKRWTIALTAILVVSLISASLGEQREEKAEPKLDFKQDEEDLIVSLMSYGAAGRRVVKTTLAHGENGLLILKYSLVYNRQAIFRHIESFTVTWRLENTEKEDYTYKVDRLPTVYLEPKELKYLLGEGNSQPTDAPDKK